MSGEIRILYVDDDESVLSSTAEYLASLAEDLDVLTETDPERALERIKQGDIDCLVSDYWMAGMDGLDFLQAVRAEFPELPFIFYTGKGSEEVASEAISNDATGYVQKTAGTDDYDLLVNRIRRAVARRRERVSYRELFANIGVGVCVRDIESYDLIEANETYCDLLGYDRERLRQLDFGDLTASREGYTRVRAREMVDEAVEHGEHDFEWPYRTDRGEVVWANVSHRVSEIRGTERILTTLQDITERKEREERLRTVNERLDLAVEGAELGVWDWEVQTGDVAFNDQFAAIVEMAPEELPSVMDAWRDRVHPEDLPEVLEGVAAHNRGETAYYDLEYRLQTGAGDWKWVQTLGRVVERERDGTPVRAVGIHMSINERKRYEQRLKQQRDNLETLNEMVRHDIRNDLQIVLAYLDTLDIHADEETQEYIDAAFESAQSAVRLTQTARDLAEAMLQADADRHPVRVASTLREQVENLRSTDPDAEVTVVGELPNRAVMANEMLDSVFRNLLQNAVEHNDKEVPEVTVSVDDREDTVVVEVADNGPGIPDSQKDDIFTKGETGLDSEGSGIGLYLVETLVDQYGGEVWVADDDPEGAVFGVELPCAGASAD
jgi:PAS domain S-box-containing protein